MACDEDCFGVLRGEGLPSLGCTGLHDERCPLRARLADVRTGHSVVFALVVDLPHARGLRVDTSFGIPDDGVVSPGRLPELVCYLDVFLGDCIAVIVFWLLRVAEVAGGRIEIAGDNLEPRSACSKDIDSFHKLTFQPTLCIH